MNSLYYALVNGERTPTINIDNAQKNQSLLGRCAHVLSTI